MKVIRDADEGEDKKPIFVSCFTILAQDGKHLGCVLVAGYYRAVGTFTEEVQKTVGCVRVVP